jgi:signal transduction histidine kinase
VIGLFEGQAREKKITLELQVDSAVPDSLFGDVDRLRQIVTHLGILFFI